jgi:hypothetical protein
MNASLARRIRNAEAILISALDRQTNAPRDWSRPSGSAHPSVRMPKRSVPSGDGSRLESHLTTTNCSDVGLPGVTSKGVGDGIQ